MSTGAEYAARRAAAEARKTIAQRLRDVYATHPLAIEAADAIDHLHAEIARIRREANEAEREFSREARGIADEARWQERQAAAGDYGSY